LPLVSRAVQTTAFVPLAKRVPEAGTQAVEATLQLSEAVAENVTLASQRPGSVAVTMFVGHVITGFFAVLHGDCKVQRFVLSLASVATQVTVVAPTASAFRMKANRPG